MYKINTITVPKNIQQNITQRHKIYLNFSASQTRLEFSVLCICMPVRSVLFICDIKSEVYF